MRNGAGKVVEVRCKARTCTSCGELWGGDTRTKLLANVEEYGGSVALVTITAPGRDVLPYDEGGREVVRSVARRWNREAREQWRAIHRKAAQRAARRAKKDGNSWRIIGRGWAFQRRGVLHVHVIVPMERASDRVYSQIYAEALAEMAGAHGFGFVDRGRRRTVGRTWRRFLEVVPQERAARYLAKYVAKFADDGRLELHSTALHPDAPGQIVYVSRELTRRTGVTMRTLRARRRLWCVAEGVGMDPCELLDLVVEEGVTFGGVDVEALQLLYGMGP